MYIYIYIHNMRRAGRAAGGRGAELDAHDLEETLDTQHLILYERLTYER